MPNVTLSFNHTINVSVQVGDIAYYTFTPPFPGQMPGQDGNWAAATTPHETNTRESVIMIGPIISMTQTSITCDMPDDLAAQYGPPANNDFIMFSKDNKVNLSSLLGYYCLTQLRNNSTEESELFTVATDFIESSK
tara:strand:+ start:13123 stop:13530 length:408 start_codon:yes stop_codon:yes gene_type:complete